MKILIFTNADGNLELVNGLLGITDTLAAISLGDLVLASQSTPIKKFLREKYRHLANQSIDWNLNNKFFVKPIYAIYGALDDPFIPKDELNIGNLFPIISDVKKFSDRNNSTIGFLSGYYNERNFGFTNPKRKNFSRERKSLSLCISDFIDFYKSKIDIFLSYESPFGYPIENRGCSNILSVIMKTECKLSVYGHHRKFDMKNLWVGTRTIKIIGLDKLENMYMIIDTDNKVASVFRHSNLVTLDTTEISYG